MRNYASLLAVTLALIPGAASAEKIIIGVAEAPPMGEKRAPGGGITPQILTASLKEVGYEVEYRFFPFARLISMVENGKILGGVAAFPRGGEANCLIKPLFFSELTFFYKRSAYPTGVNYTSLADLAKYRIGIMRGAPHTEDLRKAGLKLDETVTESSNFGKLKMGRIDLASTLDLIGMANLRALGETRADYGTTKALAVVPNQVAFSKKYPNSQKLMNDLSKGFEIARQKGSIAKILESFYGGKVPDWVFGSGASAPAR